jgi:hypothetical protein
MRPRAFHANACPRKLDGEVDIGSREQALQNKKSLTSDSIRTRQALSCAGLPEARQPPANYRRLDGAAGFVIAPLAVDKAAAEWQLICAAMIFAKHFHQLLRRRLAAAIELRQPFFARCHLIDLHSKKYARPLLEFPASKSPPHPSESTTRECGISVVSLTLLPLFAHIAVMRF